MIKANNRKIDPNKVYRKNKKFALTLRSREPQIPIIKNIGIKMLSKKTKNIIKSIAENERIKKISKAKKYIQ